MVRPAIFVLGLLIAAGLSPLSAQGRFGIDDCPSVAESQFKYVPLVARSVSTQTKALAIDNTLAEPIHMAFDSRPGDKVDVYFTQRNGTVKKFSGTDNTLSTVGSITVSTTSEMGLTGIALDPAFKTNNWMYLFYAVSNELRLSRFTLAAGKLEASTEKRLLAYRKVTSGHMGGALAFDSNGDLWISTGNDASDYPKAYNEDSEGGSSEASSANLNDFRGGVLRIHPDNSAKGYSIPTGNFAEYWSAWFKAKGNDAVAAEYAEPSKVKPELYVKGVRNAYSIAVDTVKHWVAFSSIGINVQTSYSEAHYLLTHPVYAGYPYFAGGFGNEPGTGYYPLWSSGEGASVFNTAHPGLTESNAGPVNNSKWNTGPKQMPPVSPAMHTYLRGNVGAAAVTGSFYHYNPASASSIKFPPHFDGAWTITDWVQNDNVAKPAGGGFQGVKIFKVKPEGDGLLDSLKWFRNMGITGPLDMQFGPDGALYVLNYGNIYFDVTSETKLARIEYSGSCHPTALSDRMRKMARTHGAVAAGSFFADRDGAYSITVSDPLGRILARHDALQGRRAYAIRDLVPADVPGGALVVTISGSGESESIRVYLD